MSKESFGPWWLTFIICVYYFIAVVGWTYWSHIARPRQKRLEADANNVRVRMAMLCPTDKDDIDAATRARRRQLNEMLTKLGRDIGAWETDATETEAEATETKSKSKTKARFSPRRRTRERKLPSLTMSSARGARLREIDRSLVYLVPATALKAYAAPLFRRLSTTDEEYARTLRQLYTESSVEGMRVVIERAHKLCDENEEIELQAQLDSERATIWLTLVGLLGITGTAAAFGHQASMLVGAIGGFLAPAVKSLTSRDAPSSWGIMMLSPVGGALTAIGGLLLVGMLSTEGVGVLGEAFRGLWASQDSVVALAVALLFGFSGQLFSSLAISAASHLDSPPGK